MVGALNFGRCWTGIGLINQFYLVLCFAGLVYLATGQWMVRSIKLRAPTTPFELVSRFCSCPRVLKQLHTRKPVNLLVNNTHEKNTPF